MNSEMLEMFKMVGKLWITENHKLPSKYLKDIQDLLLKIHTI